MADTPQKPDLYEIWRSRFDEDEEDLAWQVWAQRLHDMAERDAARSKAEALLQAQDGALNDGVDATPKTVDGGM
jgi:hypothetical protein